VRGGARGAGTDAFVSGGVPAAVPFAGIPLAAGVSMPLAESLVAGV